MERSNQDREGTTMEQRFSDQQLERIIDEATIYMCACPAQVAAAIRDLRGLYRYQQDCLEAPSSERPVHQLIAASTNTAHAELEECLDRVLDLEGWDRQTLRMPEGLRRKREESLAGL
ncbi:hypothetical protein [Azospira oryzae]|nr:hypothetical protein [Azospira oryzae]